MSNDGNSPYQSPECDGNMESELGAVLSEYIDRLNAGETVTPEEVLSEYPTAGREILEQLEAYVEVSSDGEVIHAVEPLGTLGDYTLRRQIGRGGMGVVYEALENSMDRVVALKVLPAGVAADDKAVARFTRA